MIKKVYEKRRHIITEPEVVKEVRSTAVLLYTNETALEKIKEDGSLPQDTIEIYENTLNILKEKSFIEIANLIKDHLKINNRICIYSVKEEKVEVIEFEVQEDDTFLKAVKYEYDKAYIEIGEVTISDIRYSNLFVYNASLCVIDDVVVKSIRKHKEDVTDEDIADAVLNCDNVVIQKNGFINVYCTKSREEDFKSILRGLDKMNLPHDCVKINVKGCD